MLSNAYLHGPLDEQDTNGSTLLLPENVLQGDYVIYNHTAYQEPNCFIVIVMQYQTYRAAAVTATEPKSKAKAATPRGASANPAVRTPAQVTALGE